MLHPLPFTLHPFTNQYGTQIEIDNDIDIDIDIN
jgi:hypothetical protein